MEPFYTPVAELQKKLHAKEIHADELEAIYQDRIQDVEPKIRGFLTHFPQPVQQTSCSPYAGLPIVIKDNMCLQDHPTTCASQILKNFIPPYHATVVERLLDAGLRIVGKANMDEFAMGSSNENSSFHLTYNPWDLSRVPGGSSGGSAALVAAGEIPWSLGSDTGGSIRLPASFCGVVGLKPTYGLVSRYGLVAFASSLDQIGPITLTVEDNARLLNLIAGHDVRDSTSIHHPVEDYTHYLGKEVKGLTIGIPQEMMGDGLAPDVRLAVEKAIDHLASLGAHLEETYLPSANHALAAYYLIATSEASSNLARYDGIRYGLRAEKSETFEEALLSSRSQGFGAEVKRRIMLGTYALSAGYYDAYYRKAQQVRTLLIQDFQRVFEKYDALLSPTAPVTAFKIGERSQDPLSMYLTDVLTVTVNLAGIPAISIPCGFDRDGLPIGLQIMAKPLNEGLIYQIAQAYEQSTQWYQRHPELV